ncbi:hypothetical protein [Sinorhizobium glycinis]|uniref:hypothetical protein n=1 Tax=Sinorhizobium glycinis TaxID=1472378 RepID=UPI000ADA765F|nr:hypothetical protein [Sinorhizobium glycinis]
MERLPRSASNETIDLQALGARVVRLARIRGCERLVASMEPGRLRHKASAPAEENRQ